MAAELTYEALIEELTDTENELEMALTDLKVLYDEVEEMKKRLKIAKESKNKLAEYANNLRKVAETRRIIEGIEEIPEKERALLKERCYYVLVQEGNRAIEL